MRKGIIFIGLALLVISIIVTLFVLPAAIAPPFYTQNITLLPGKFQHMDFNISNSTQLFIFYANFSTPVNLFVFSQKGFDLWSANVTYANSANGFSYAKKLEGNGTLAIYKDISNFFVSTQQVSNNGNTIFASNNSNEYNTNFTFVFQDSNGNITNTNISNAKIRYIPPLSLTTIQTNPKISSYFYLVGGLEFVFVVVAIVGIGMIVYGILKKPKEISYEGLKSGGKLDEAIKERDALYKNIGAETKKNKIKKGKNESA